MNAGHLFNCVCLNAIMALSRHISHDQSEEGRRVSGRGSQ